MSLQTFSKAIEETLNCDFNILNVKEAYAHLFHQPQTLLNSCAINAQMQILEERLGIEIDEGKISAFAQKNGYFNVSDGTPPEFLSKILNQAGVETQNGYLNGVAALKSALDDGNDVIIPVDSNELYNGIEANPNGSDHAVRIIGHQNGVFSIQDPAKGLIKIPENTLSNAWDDSNFRAVIIPPSDIEDLSRIYDKIYEMQDSISSQDLFNLQLENDYALKEVFGENTSNFLKTVSEQAADVESLSHEIQKDISEINIDVQNIIATGGYIALMQFFKDNPQKQKTVTKVTLALGVFDAFTDFSGDEVSLDFEINPLLITSLAYYISQLTSKSKNIKLQKFSMNFNKVLSKGMKVIEYAGYAAISIEFIEFLTNAEFNEFFLQIVDAVDFLDFFGDVEEAASRGFDLTEGIATLGLSIAASKFVRWIFNKINKDDIINISTLTRKTTPKKTLALLLEADAPVELLLGPYIEMMKES
jgi:hypothetical protein